MIALILMLCLVLLSSPDALAQDATPVAELSAGYSLVNADGRQWNGWLVGGSVSVVRWFGVAAEVGGNSHTERYSFGGQGFEARGTRRFAGGGPRFAARGRRVTGFAQLLVGAEDTFGKSLLAIQAGGGADFWIARRLGVRLGLDGRTHWYEDEQEGSWRLQVGGVVAVGSR